MQVSRVFIEQKITTGDIISLPEDKAHHLAHVIRLRVGDKIRLFDNSEFEFEICPALTWTRSADPVIFGIDFRIPIVSGSSLNNFPLLLMGMVGYTFK